MGGEMQWEPNQKPFAFERIRFEFECRICPAGCGSKLEAGFVKEGEMDDASFGVFLLMELYTVLLDVVLRRLTERP